MSGPMYPGGAAPGPFSDNPFAAPSGPPPGMPIPAAPDPRRDEVNTLATLSVIFAFVFAPAGAILGHIALYQIGGSGQKGRQRALVGVTLSYAFIVALIVALIVWAVLGSVKGDSPAAAAPTMTTATTAAAAAETTKARPTPTVAPVAAGALSGLLLSMDDIRNIMGVGSLALIETDTSITPTSGVPVTTPPNCVDVTNVGVMSAYDGTDFRDTFGQVFSDSNVGASAQQVVTLFDTPSAARAAVDKYVEHWKGCTGTMTEAIGGGIVLTLTVDQPTITPDGMATLNSTVQGVPVVKIGRAVAAKNNVLVDVASSGTMVSDQPVTIARQILGRIPS